MKSKEGIGKLAGKGILIALLSRGGVGVDQEGTSASDSGWA